MFLLVLEKRRRDNSINACHGEPPFGLPKRVLIARGANLAQGSLDVSRVDEGVARGTLPARVGRDTSRDVCAGDPGNPHAGVFLLWPVRSALIRIL